MTSLGNVTTGDGSQGIVAGSLGLGGGASAVTVTGTGNIATGSDSQGILAQNFAILAVGPITVTSLGNVAATGTNSVGIMANSFGNASGNISVNVLGGTVTGGNGSGIGVELIDGACGVLQTHQRRGPLGRRLLGFRPPKLLRCARRELSARRGSRASAHACGRRFRLVWHHACFESSTRTRVMGY